jgi:hypothetical protein
MPRAGVRSVKRGGRSLGTAKKAEPKSLVASKVPKFHRFIGLSLGGGKTDKTALAMIEYYPVQKKIFLSQIHDKIKTENEISADLQIHRMVTEASPNAESVCFDVPLTLPKCLLCVHKCPGYEFCEEPEIQWMWRQHRSKPKKKSPPRLFTPYTERCVEQYLQTELEEPFHLSHAMGANLAPLTARAQYITRRFKKQKTLEVFPKLSLWRIGKSLKISESLLRVHRHWDGGEDSRRAVLNKMVELDLAFFYQEDVKLLVESPHAFDAFICALTGLLSFMGHCEARPKGFPKQEGWLEIPKTNFVWP